MKWNKTGSKVEMEKSAKNIRKIHFAIYFSTYHTGISQSIINFLCSGAEKRTKKKRHASGRWIWNHEKYKHNNGVCAQQSHTRQPHSLQRRTSSGEKENETSKRMTSETITRQRENHWFYSYHFAGWFIKLVAIFCENKNGVEFSMANDVFFFAAESK